MIFYGGNIRGCALRIAVGIMMLGLLLASTASAGTAELDLDPLSQSINVGSTGTYTLTLNTTQAGNLSWDTESTFIDARIDSEPFSQSGKISVPLGVSTHTLQVKPLPGITVNEGYNIEIWHTQGGAAYANAAAVATASVVPLTPPVVTKISIVHVNVIGVGVVGQNLMNIVKVEYFNFSSDDAYNISVYYPNGTLAYFTSGTLTGANPEIIPVDYVPTVTGDHIVTAYGNGILGTTQISAYDSAPIPVISELNQAPDQPIELTQFKSDGTTQITVGGATTEHTVVFSARVSDPEGDKVRLQVELRRTDEYGGIFDENAGGLKEGDLVTSGSVATTSAIELIDGTYHWRARAVDDKGNKGAWVEFGDNPTLDADFAVSTASATTPHIVITAPLKIIGPYPYYKAGDVIKSQFTITNQGDASIVLKVLTVGGRDSYGRVVDFDWEENINLGPGESHYYLESLILPDLSGNYNFFVAYQTEDDNWNTAVDLAPGLTEDDRMKNILEDGAVLRKPQEYSTDRSGMITLEDGSDIPIYVPEIIDNSNVIREDGDWKTVNEIKKSYPFIDWWQVLSGYQPEELESGSIDVGKAAGFSLIGGAIQSITESTTTIDLDIIIQKDSNNKLRAIIQYGNSQVHLEDRKIVDNPLQATGKSKSNAIAEAFDLDPNQLYGMIVKFDTFHENDEYIGYISLSTDNKIILTPKVYPEDKINVELCDGILSCISHSNIIVLDGNFFLGLMESRLNDAGSMQIRETLSPIYLNPKSGFCIQVHSPVELRVYDTQNRVTGLVNGDIKQEIQNSLYYIDSERIAIFDSTDTYRYEVIGTETGTYGLDIISFKGGITTTFIATDIPTTSGQNHQYTVDWNALSEGLNGVTVQLDNNGDGIFEQTIQTGNNFVYDIVPPTTNFLLSGTLGNNGWYRSDVQVNLTATDNAGGSGVNKTEYSFDNATWITYNANFTVTTEGKTTLYFRSTDNAGNVEQTKNQTIKIDKTSTIIDLVTVYPANTTAGSTINITVSSSDNLGVVEVTANGGTSFTNNSGVWEGSIIAAPAVGTYDVILRAKDAAGNEAQKTVKYSVVYRSGGVSITSTPKPLSIVQGSSGLLNIKLMSTANIDDTVEVTINTTGLSAKSSWFNRTYVSVQVPAGKTVLVPFSVTIPAGTASGFKTFKDYAKSRGFNLTSTDAGIVNVKT